MPSCSSLRKKRELEDRKETSPNKRKPESDVTTDSAAIATPSESETKGKAKEQYSTGSTSNQFRNGFFFTVKYLEITSE